MPTKNGLTEPDIVINGIALPFAECMVVRVAVGGFRIQLADPAYRSGLGEILAAGYDYHLAQVERVMLEPPAEDRRPTGFNHPHRRVGD